MTSAEIESQVIQELHRLPPEKAEELLDFALFLRYRVGPSTTQASRQRPLGLLKGKATCVIEEDFSISDEEILRLGIDTCWIPTLSYGAFSSRRSWEKTRVSSSLKPMPGLSSAVSQSGKSP